MPSDSLVFERTVRFRTDLYCCVAERLELMSYPGLACVYITHYCGVQILDIGLPVFQMCGLPDGSSFETLEDTGKINRWSWTEIEKAQASGVKGFPKCQQSEDTPLDRPWTRIQATVNPLNLSSLEMALEKGGVNVNQWGQHKCAVLESLLRELKSGIATLETDVETGKICRVLPSAAVQVNNGCTRTESEKVRGVGERRGLRSRTDPACFEVSDLDVSSYPGLRCVLRTRIIQFERSGGRLGTM